MKYDWKKEREKYQVWKEPVSDGSEQPQNILPRMEHEVPQKRQPVEPQKKSYTWLILILILGVGYYFYVKNTPEAPVPTPRPAETPAPAPKPAETPAPAPRPTPGPVSDSVRKVYKPFAVPGQQASTAVGIFGKKMQLQLILQEDFVKRQMDKHFTETVPVAKLDRNFMIENLPDSISEKFKKNIVLIAGNIQKTLSFFQQYFNCVSYDGKKSPVIFGYGMYRHVNSLYVIEYNAARYGCGDSSLFIFGLPLIDLGTVGHEFTHAIVGMKTWNGKSIESKQAAELIYAGESGALHEGFADIFGMLVLRAWNPEIVGTAKGWFMEPRNMKDPHEPDKSGNTLPAYYQEPGYWKDIDPRSPDNGGVHSNQGPLLKLAYLLAEGDEFRNYKIHGMGDEKMGRFFWALLTMEPQLPINATYADLGARLEKACQMCNFTEEEKQNVRKAAKAINMPGMKQESHNNLTFGEKLAMSLGGGNRPDMSFDRGRVRYITFPEKSPLRCSLSANGSLDEHAAGFLLRFGKDLGVSSSVSDYKFEKLSGTQLNLQQMHKGIEVFAGNMTFVADPLGGISRIMNSLSSNLSGNMDVRPSLSREETISRMRKQYPDEAFNDAVLTILDPVLVGSRGVPVLTWQLVSQHGKLPCRRYFVNAENGNIEFSYDLFTSR